MPTVETKRVIELTEKGDDRVIAYACSVCRRLTGRNRSWAESCCLCSGCGIVLAEFQHECEACKEARFRAGHERRASYIAGLPRKLGSEWDGAVYSEGLDRWAESWDSLLDYYGDEEGLQPVFPLPQPVPEARPR